MSAAVPSDGGGGGSTGPGASGFDIGGLPQLDDGDTIRAAAATFSTSVGAVHSHAVSVKSDWGKLSGQYNAPEQHVVLAAMNKPETDAQDLVTKVGKVKSALDTYAGHLDHLQTQKNALITDIQKLDGDVQSFKDHSVSFLGLEWSFHSDSDLLSREEDIRGRIDGLAANLDTYQRDCANAIDAIFGGPVWKAYDESSGDYKYHFGMSSDGYSQLDQTGKSTWGSPDAWRHATLGTATTEFVDGFVNGMIIEPGKMLLSATGVFGQGKADAARYALGKMVQNLTSDDPAVKGKAFLDLGKGLIGWGKWGTSPYATAGAVVPNIVLAAFTDGGSAAVDGVLSTLARVMPRAAESLGGMYAAGRVLRATTLGKVAEGAGGVTKFPKTWVRNGAYRTYDAGRWSAQAMRRAGHGLTEHLSPKLVTPDGLVMRAPERAGDHMMMKVSEPTPGKNGWPASGYHEGGVAKEGTTVFRGGGKGEDGLSDMLARPPATEHTKYINLYGDKLAPKAGEAFGAKGGLEANMRYEVRNRGVFYTDDHGKVVFAEVERPSVTLKGLPRARPAMSPDLRHPLKNVTYRLEDRVQLHTNEYGQTDHVQIEDLELKSDTLRSGTSQSKVAGGTEYDAGHLVARMFGGPREEINLVKMLPDINQDKFRQFENQLASRVGNSDHVRFDLVLSGYKGNSAHSVPKFITVDAEVTTPDGATSELHEVFRQ